MILARDPLANPEQLIRRVYAYVASRVGDGPLAEDVTSATFERALRSRDSYRRERGEPIAWLIGIARRCIADAFARREDPPIPLPVRHEDVEEETVRRLDLVAAVARLDEVDRELIALRYGADLTARQIGRLLGVRTNTVEVRLHRALARLRRELGSDEPAALPAALARVRI